jgi:hypothetical protein
MAATMSPQISGIRVWRSAVEFADSSSVALQARYGFVICNQMSVGSNERSPVFATTLECSVSHSKRKDLD